MLELLPIGNSSGNMKFSWLLEGLDANWSRPSELHFINYTNLPGGNFKLHIRMYDSSLSQMIDERSLNIHVTPPFWKTWWFAAIISLCTICYIIYAFKVIRTAWSGRVPMTGLLPMLSRHSCKKEWHRQNRASGKSCLCPRVSQVIRS